MKKQRSIDLALERIFQKYYAKEDHYKFFKRYPADNAEDSRKENDNNCFPIVDEDNDKNIKDEDQEDVKFYNKLFSNVKGYSECDHNIYIAENKNEKNLNINKNQRLLENVCEVCDEQDLQMIGNSRAKSNFTGNLVNKNLNSNQTINNLALTKKIDNNKNNQQNEKEQSIKKKKYDLTKINDVIIDTFGK